MCARMSEREYVIKNVYALKNGWGRMKAFWQYDRSKQKRDRARACVSKAQTK